MDVREMLIEILRKPIFPHELADPTEAVADYLLDNGVTVQEWIPVTERLPEDSDNVLVCHKNGLVTTNAWLGANWWFKNERNPITHWMPMPQPPKGE